MPTTYLLLMSVMALVSLGIPVATLTCLIVAYRRLLALERRLDRIVTAGAEPEDGRGTPVRGGQITILRLMALIAAVAVLLGLIRALGLYVISLLSLASTIAILVLAVLLMRGLRPGHLGAKLVGILRKPDDLE
jgi:hypothetical protein